MSDMFGVFHQHWLTLYLQMLYTSNQNTKSWRTLIITWILSLTHYGVVMPYGLMTPYGDTDQSILAQAMARAVINIDLPSVSPMDIYLRTSQEGTHLSITKISLKISCVQFHFNLPGANEFKHLHLCKTLLNTHHSMLSNCMWFYRCEGLTLLVLKPGGWFNIKIPSYQNRKSHCGDKTILRPSYLHNGISYTGKHLYI